MQKTTVLNAAIFDLSAKKTWSVSKKPGVCPSTHVPARVCCCVNCLFKDKPVVDRDISRFICGLSLRSYNAPQQHGPPPGSARPGPKLELRLEIGLHSPFGSVSDTVGGGVPGSYVL